jgi:hypothetical protein
VFAANSEPGRRRPTGRGLPPLGHGDQAFALRLFPGSLARASTAERDLRDFEDDFTEFLQEEIPGLEIKKKLPTLAH